MPLAGVSARFQPVWVEDVAEAIVTCLDRDDTTGRTFECAGPQVFTLGELVRLAGRLSGHERPLITLPDALGTLQALTMEMLPGTPLMSRDNILSMRRAEYHGEFPGLEPRAFTPLRSKRLPRRICRLARAWRD